MPKVPPKIFRHPLFQQVRKTMLGFGFTIPEGDKPSDFSLLVALSGGADSVAMLRVLLLLDFRCEALHCNFHLRGEDSDRDQLFVQRLCEQLDVPLHSVHFDTFKYAHEESLSIEMAARELRYQFFEQESKKRDEAFVAIGHHLNDNIETVLQHLAMGCGIAGLRGIPPQRDRYIRPLIDCRQASIRSFLALLEQSYCEDATNQEIIFERNYIRHELAPRFTRLNPSYEEAFQRTIANVRESEKLVKYALERLKKEAQIDEKGLVFDAHKIAFSPAPLSLLHEILTPKGFSRKRLAIFAKNLTDSEPATIESATHRVRRQGRKLIISPIEE